MLAIIAALVAGATQASDKVSETRVEPSFQCGAGLSPTETAICRDGELRAYDRAVAFAYANKWRSTGWGWSTQREWLTYRSKCGVDRSCVLGVYKEWIDGLDYTTDVRPSHERIAGPPDDGSDLFLGTLQSPTGRVKRLEDVGTLFIRPLGEGWHFFKATAAHLYDPHDGLGENVSTSEAIGLVRVVNGKGRFIDDPSDPQSCTVEFTPLSAGRWRLVEHGWGCSGIGSSLTGIYGK